MTALAGAIVTPSMLTSEYHQSIEGPTIILCDISLIVELFQSGHHWTIFHFLISEVLRYIIRQTKKCPVTEVSC